MSCDDEDKQLPGCRVQKSTSETKRTKCMHLLCNRHNKSMKRLTIKHSGVCCLVSKSSLKVVQERNCTSHQDLITPGRLSICAHPRGDLKTTYCDLKVVNKENWCRLRFVKALYNCLAHFRLCPDTTVKSRQRERKKGKETRPSTSASTAHCQRQTGRQSILASVTVCLPRQSLYLGELTSRQK